VCVCVCVCVLCVRHGIMLASIPDGLVAWKATYCLCSSEEGHSAQHHGLLYAVFD